MLSSLSIKIKQNGDTVAAGDMEFVNARDN